MLWGENHGLDYGALGAAPCLTSGSVYELMQGTLPGAPVPSPGNEMMLPSLHGIKSYEGS